MTVVIIPAYKPEDMLIELVGRLTENNLAVLVVNDGSGKEYDGIFNRLTEMATVITLKKNCGKGAALKEGIKSLEKNFPDCKNFITADADGQHTVADILAVRDELNSGTDFVLTTRRLRGKIPKKSKLGNTLSRWIYTILTGHYFEDNQSGLRGFSIKNVEWLLRVGGDKYDYEMNMLYYADKQNLPITTISIDTVYINGNSASHFDPFSDTVKIYKQLFKSARVSFLTFLLAELLIMLSTSLLGFRHLYITVPSAGIISAFIGIFLNKFFVFKNIKYGDGLRTISYTLIRFTAYMAGCSIVHSAFSAMSLFVAFNIVVMAVVPVEYLLHRLIRLAKFKDINKEKR